VECEGAEKGIREGRGVEWIRGVDGARLDDDGGDGLRTGIRVPTKWSGWSGFILKTSEKKRKKGKKGKRGGLGSRRTRDKSTPPTPPGSIVV
jgi:hypothetical protein